MIAVLAWWSVRTPYETDTDRLLERARVLLGAADDAVLGEANQAVNSALMLDPDSVEGWLLKCQVASATGDDLAALAAAEMALARAPDRAACLYWCGAVLGDLGRPREALSAIESAFDVLGDGDAWLLEDLFYEKIALLEALGLPAAALDACEAGLAACPGSALLRSVHVPAERARVRSTLKVLPGGVS